MDELHLGSNFTKIKLNFHLEFFLVVSTSFLCPYTTPLIKFKKLEIFIKKSSFPSIKFGNQKIFIAFIHTSSMEKISSVYIARFCENQIAVKSELEMALQ